MKTTSGWACLAAIALGVWVAGCKGDCRQLAEQICACATTSADQDACNQNVANEDARIQPTTQDNLTCRKLIKQCDCHLIDTPQGKIACGLARPPGTP